MDQTVFNELARDNNFLCPDKTIACTPQPSAGTVKNFVKYLGRARIDTASLRYVGIRLVYILSPVP
jgi:hypothetical protein